MVVVVVGGLLLTGLNSGSGLVALVCCCPYLPTYLGVPTCGCRVGATEYVCSVHKSAGCSDSSEAVRCVDYWMLNGALDRGEMGSR